MRQIAELLYPLPSLSSLAHFFFFVTCVIPRLPGLMTLTFSSVIQICACVFHFSVLSAYGRPRQFFCSGSSDNSHTVAVDLLEVSSRRAVGQWSCSVCRGIAVCLWLLHLEDNLDKWKILGESLGSFRLFSCVIRVGYCWGEIWSQPGPFKCQLKGFFTLKVQRLCLEMPRCWPACIDFPAHSIPFQQVASSLLFQEGFLELYC